MMSIRTIGNCLFIFFGAIIMLTSIIRAKGLMEAMPFVPERQRKHIKRYILLHRGLMIFFFFGYLATLTAFVFKYSLISETFVSLIFLFGAVFVFIGIDVQSRLLSEVQTTLHGILPICFKCKKIRIDGGNPKDPRAWKRIENFISKRADVEFSHGVCPECFEEELKKIEGTKRKA
ncbi:MAG: hypothetical protein PVG86_06810 [Desulfobacterales bacterium]|jgi:hypothetical protein